MFGAIEVMIQAVTYRCYRTVAKDGVETYIVAGLGTLVIDRATGTIRHRHAVIRGGELVLDRIGPLLHRAAPLPR